MMTYEQIARPMLWANLKMLPPYSYTKGTTCTIQGYYEDGSVYRFEVPSDIAFPLYAMYQEWRMNNA